MVCVVGDQKEEQDGRHGIDREKEESSFLNSMSLVVQGQMIGSREASITILAFERFTSCVFSEMPSQLITPSEPPLATIP